MQFAERFATLSDELVNIPRIASSVSMACSCKLRYNREANSMYITKEVNSMGNRNINNKETKKKKKVDVAAPTVSLKSVVAPQPEVIKKAKKPRAADEEE